MFTKTSLDRLLTNVAYLGKVRYKDEIYGGPPRSPRYEPVHAPADQGCPAEEIAHRTDIPLGEVQLVLNLRPRTNAQQLPQTATGRHGREAQTSVGRPLPSVAPPAPNL